MRGLQSLFLVRLFRPSEGVCEDWFHRRGVHGAPIVTSSWFDPVALASGDLRVIRIGMEWRARFKRLPTRSAAMVVNPFEAVRKIFLRSLEPEVYAASANALSTVVVQQYTPEYVSDLDTLADALDDLSYADAMRGREVAHELVAKDYSDHIVATGTRLRSTARRVGALVPRLVEHRGRIDLDKTRALQPTKTK